MKVLFINSVLRGSTGKICLDLQNELLRCGHDALICYGRGKKSDDSNKVLIGNNLSTLADAFKSRILDNQGLNSKQNTRRLIQYIKKYSPDIIHIHNIHGYYLNYAIFFNYLKSEYKGSVIWTLHDCWPFTGHCSHFDFVNCDKWKTCCFSCPQKNFYPKSPIFDSSKKNFLMKKFCFTGIEKMHLVTPSKWLKEIVGFSFLNNYPCQVINNGIDTSSFKNDARFCRNCILFVSSIWIERKGSKLLSRIISGITTKYKIVIIGKWKTKKPRIQQAIFIDRVLDKVEMSEWYNRAVCFVNPTLEDTYPTVNIEAQCCGAPVISFETGGAKETIFIPHSQLIEKGNVKEMINAINVFTSVENCFEVSDSSYFSSSRMYKEYLELYLEVIQNGR